MNIGDTKFENIQQFINEYEILNLLNHPAILKTFGIFLSNEGNPPSILLEYCTTDLSKAVKKNSLSNVQIVFYIYQIAEGMKCIHFNKIIHRDLKPTNILITDDDYIRIGDFGISKLITDEELSLTVGLGTQKFMAPELINEEKYNEKVDVYAFGVIVFFILNNGKIPKITVTQVGNGKKAEIPSAFTKYSKSLIDRCWNFDPKDRPTFKVICDEIIENKFNLIELTQSERFKITTLIDQYKRLIPPNKK